ncbi:MAG: endopeptidase La [Oscillospiraceae bacterium]|nr:endopeptidase La [Oscillospiraceae bacterium]MDD3833245.1 endopeptidase La [Oscillospiraceae bacterium]MDD4545850.1 endopeptidase La [Oscillospiraceae bacterium]
METKRQISRLSTLPLLALRGLVVFPDMVLHFDVGRKKSMLALNEAMSSDQTIFLITQRDLRDDDPDEESLYAVGVVAKIRQVLRLPGDNVRVLVEGLYRAKIKEITGSDTYYTAKVRECISRRVTEEIRVQALLRQCRNSFEEYAVFAPKISPDVLLGVSTMDDLDKLSDYIASNILLPTEEKQLLLETLDPEKRMEKLIIVLEREISILSVEQGIRERVQEQIDQNQKEYYLREQIKVIAQELGEADNPQDEAQSYIDKIKSLKLDAESEKKMFDECARLSKMPAGSHEATVIRGLIETCLSLPWNKFTKDNLIIDNAAKVLDRDHYGLEKVKERILESLAVQKMASKTKGQVICLAGPPGVGKTSIAKSIAQAMGRKYVRVSLGGMRDEADIRGHRRTYIGAMPGRIINAIRQAGSANPLFLLDEIDKMGNDFRGDPASAMLEVLDTEQNSLFRDHYLEIPFDLSQVMFVTTANNLNNIPKPLYDRMEIIEIPSYTSEEKFHIAKKFLLKKQVKLHGLDLRRLRISDDAIREIIDGYTRESGVRGLERCIIKICRKTARRLVDGNNKSVKILPENIEEYLGPRRYKDDVNSICDGVGVVNGLAWTSVGGEMMPIEVAILDGTGKIELTGSMGDVMKESARTAISYVRSRAAEFFIDKDFYKTKDIHIHVPEGAVPKDGPSAGVTIATAIISALTNIPVSGNVAMTGEITLRGRILPIGGLREKTMAAYRHLIKTVIIPGGNQADMVEIDKAVLDNINIITADHLDTVISHSLVSMPTARQEDKKDGRFIPTVSDDNIHKSVPQ